MFIQLSQMMSQANLSGIHMMLRPLGEGKISVVVATESAGFKADNPALKAALAQPLNVAGEVTELESTFTEALNNFIESYAQHSVVSNDPQVTQGHSEAAAAVKADEKKPSEEATNKGASIATESQKELDESAVITDDSDDSELF